MVGKMILIDRTKKNLNNILCRGKKGVKYEYSLLFRLV